ncbi:MAG: O-antigen ligase family protein [Cyanobacteria bacterium P01_F01_bin.56]
MEQFRFTDKNAIALLLLSGLGVLVGIIAGISISAEPLLTAAWIFLVVALFGALYVATNFEFALLALLVIRSALDAFYPLPSLFAIGLEALTIAYVSWQFLQRRPIKTDRFWWFFFGWVVFQGLWVVLAFLGGLGLSSSVFFTGVREWLRMMTWVVVYLLVMQLKRFSPDRAITLLFFSLVIPLTVAALQLVVPGALPSDLAPYLGTRVSGTLGHPATFSTFLLFFIGLTWWKLGHTQHRLPWLTLLAVLGFFLVSAQSLTMLAMLLVMLAILIIPRLSAVNLLGVLIFTAMVLGLLLSTELGQERIASVLETPLLNPDINWSRSVLLSWRDGNSFNWRVAQWTFLLDAWRNSPLLGHGLNTSSFLTIWENYAHNDYVRSLAEQGVVGFISFLLFLAAQAIYLVKLMVSLPVGSRKRDLCFVLFAFFVASLIGMATDNLWSHTALYSYWWAMFGVLSWDWQETARRKSKEVVG